MRFIRPGGGTVEISETALDTMRKHGQIRADAAEAGGILLGRLIDGNDVVIDEVTEPGRKDRRGRFFFWRARDSAQQRVNDAWRASGGTTVYLGEWHTHPEDEPHPSTTDLTDWQRIVNGARFEQNFLVFAIVGRKAVRLWELAKAESFPTPLAAARPSDIAWARSKVHSPSSDPNQW